MLSSGSIVVANSKARCRERKLYDLKVDQPKGPRRDVYSLDVHNNGKIPRQSFI